MVKIEITENQANQRLDRFLKKYLDNAPLSLIYKMIRKDIKVNGKRAKEETILQFGDELSFYMSEEEIKSFQKVKKAVRAKKQFKIAYEDENILVAEKPFGLLTHGDSTEKKNHLLNQVIDYLIEKGDYDPRIEKTFTPAAVNRLDRNTTGLVLFGKNNTALQELNRMIREKDSISKVYQTIVAGKLEKSLVLKDRMIKDGEKNMITVIKGEGNHGVEKVGEGKTLISKSKSWQDSEVKDMETIVTPIKSAEYMGQWFTLVEVEIITGRTHQIRAHLKSAGYPVIGDVKYGDYGVNQIVRKKFNLNTQLLHAYKLQFNRTNEDDRLAYLGGKTITCDLSEDFQKIAKVIFK